MDSRLVPYIAKYLHEGHSLEQIRQALLKQNIPEEDIKNAVVIAMNQSIDTVSRKHSTIWIIPSIVFIVLIIGVAVFFALRVTPTPSETYDKTLTANLACDMNCFIESAKTCTPATTEFKALSNDHGKVAITDSRYEIRRGTQCQLYIKVNSQTFKYTEEYKRDALSLGIPQSQLDSELQSFNDAALVMNGKDGTCAFTSTNNLYTMLTKIKQGTMSGSITCQYVNGEWQCIPYEDWTLGDCKGSMFA